MLDGDAMLKKAGGRQGVVEWLRKVHSCWEVGVGQVDGVSIMRAGWAREGASAV